MAKNESAENGSENSSQKFIYYKKRWIVMANLSLLNLSISMVWFGFSPVAYKVSHYYKTDVTTVNWLSMIFIVVSIPCGFLWSWMMNRVGLRVCMHTSAWMALAGACVRICSTIEGIPETWQLVLLFVGQIMVAIVQPLALYSSPKLAAVWFPAHQRSISTTSTGMATPVAVVFTGLISPLFVGEPGVINMRNMLIAYACLPCFCAILTSLVMTSDAPPTPPSYGGTVTTSENFWSGVKQLLFHNRNFVILMVSVGTGISLYSAFATLVEQVLCPWGYTDTIAGVCASVMTFAGLVGAIVVSIIVDRTKRFAEALKFMFICAAVATIVFSVTYKIYMGYLIALEMGLLGFLSFGISPIGINTGAEISFPVGVSIGTALIQMSGQIQSVIMIILLESIGRPMSADELSRHNSKCHTLNLTTVEQGTPDYEMTTSRSTTVEHEVDLGGVVTNDLTISAYVMSGIITTVALTFLVLFRPTYKRMLAERGATCLPSTEAECNAVACAEEEESSSSQGTEEDEKTAEYNKETRVPAEGESSTC